MYRKAWWTEGRNLLFGILHTVTLHDLLHWEVGQWFTRQLPLTFNISYSAERPAGTGISWKNEPPLDKTNKMTVRPAKTQISLGIRPVWSESSLCAQWVAEDPVFLHADSEVSDQTGRMSRLIWVFSGRTCHFGWYFIMHNADEILRLTSSNFVR